MCRRVRPTRTRCAPGAWPARARSGRTWPAAPPVRAAPRPEPSAKRARARAHAPEPLPTLAGRRSPRAGPPTWPGTGPRAGPRRAAPPTCSPAPRAAPGRLRRFRESRRPRCPGVAMATRRRRVGSAADDAAKVKRGASRGRGGRSRGPEGPPNGLRISGHGPVTTEPQPGVPRGRDAGCWGRAGGPRPRPFGPSAGNLLNRGLPRSGAHGEPATPRVLRGLLDPGSSEAAGHAGAGGAGRAQVRGKEGRRPGPGLRASRFPPFPPFTFRFALAPPWAQVATRCQT